MVQHISAGQQSEGVEYRIIRPDGEVRVLRGKGELACGKSGQPRILCGTVHDITDSKQTAQALAESRTMLQLVLDTIPERVFWKDTSLRFLGCNTLFAHDAGFATPDELIGKDDFAMGWREQAPRYQRDDLQVITSGVSRLNYGEPQTTPEGRHIWLRTSKMPLRDIHDTIIGMLGVYEDITARKDAEVEREQLCVQYNTRPRNSTPRFPPWRTASSFMGRC